ncbi:unnamed protein product [Paramecium primaurelia]|uniref:Glutathione S-transferase n=2 Tax=Paramecium TaxID=5884 RepID=A0A8S1XSL5_9CILI|nr:unnamed protein product [Paramecium primaurelia]CAD8204466.1 unnamed protein product [Paramecium pentaurelia]
MSTSRLAIRLYTYRGYSAPWRVSIMLKLKQLQFQPFFVNLPKAEQLSNMYSQINPLQIVPTLEINGQLLHESMAIAEYLEEEFPRNKLLPKSPLEKAIVRSMCETVNSGIHPYHASRFYKYVHNYVSDINRQEISEPFLERGFTALNTLVEKHGGDYAFGNQVTIADAFLYPAFRGDDVSYLVNLDKYPALKKVVENLDQLPEFAYEHPDSQG